MSKAADAKQPELPRDLPPVEAPSVATIVQLFLIPAAVVVVGVVVVLLFGQLPGGQRDAMDYVRAIQAENDFASRRWRAAYELANLIHNDSNLAADPNLMGALTEALDRELARGDSTDDPRVAEYLALTLGAFRIDGATGRDDRPADPLGTLAEAVGSNRPTPVRLAAAESLARHAARREGGLEHPAAVAALGAVGTDAPPELRQRAVYALGFFGGEPAAQALRARIEAGDEDRFVRYNAAAALARRGDLTALPVVREMLTPDDLRRAVQLETEALSSSTIEGIELEALRALQAAARSGRVELPEAVRPEVTRLSASGLASVRTEAAALLKILPAP